MICTKQGMHAKICNAVPPCQTLTLPALPSLKACKALTVPFVSNQQVFVTPCIDTWQMQFQHIMCKQAGFQPMTGANWILNFEQLASAKYTHFSNLQYLKVRAKMNLCLSTAIRQLQTHLCKQLLTADSDAGQAQSHMFACLHGAEPRLDKPASLVLLCTAELKSWTTGDL